MRGAATRALGVASIVGVLAAAACLEDLPAATECPPDAQRGVGDCIATFEEVTAAGCLGPVQASCLLGETSSCACGADSCPEVEGACWPEGDCPPDVTRVAGDDARCVLLAGSDIGQGFPLDQCLCGCPSCATVCDGKGIVLGQYAPTEEELGFPLTIKLPTGLPAKGRLGVQVRARGYAYAVVAVLGAVEGTPISIWPLDEQLLSDRFETQVFWESTDYPDTPYRWSKPEDAPTAIVIAHQPSLDRPTLLEIDCVVPFYLEDE